MMKYTLVQHSGYGYKGNPQFQQAVEERDVTRRSEIARVEHEGGLLFDNYVEAHDAAFEVNYPPEVRGLIPEARGKFSKTLIDGLKLYIPERTNDTDR
jgi:hypothetical protein